MLRSLLFLPGNNPNMLVNGDILGSDAIIFDLEDAVAPDEKDAARILVRNSFKYLDYTNVQTVIRINSLDANEFWKQDLSELIALKPDFILPPKVNTVDDIREISQYIDKLEQKHGIEVGSTGLIPLIETALGVENAYAIASSNPRVQAIFLGAEDLTADLGCARSAAGNEIFYARTRIVTAARAAGIQAIDTPFTDINDEEGIYADVELAKSLGFSGKAAISPRHVKAINSVFTPTEAEIAYANEVLEAIERAQAQGKGAISLYGKMIDKPIVIRAEKVLEIAAQIYGRGGGDSE